MDVIRILTNYLQELNVVSITVRILLAMLIGGNLGMERERKRRPAGLRTYMLVCVGACLVMMTNMYMTNMYGVGDPARLPAQVITGIGFLGAGTIMVTKNNQVTGLTTAAGLWGTACIGLALGAGFYYGAILSFVVFALSMRVFSRIDERIIKSSNKMSIYVELRDVNKFHEVLTTLRDEGFHVDSFNIDKGWNGTDSASSAVLELRTAPGKNHSETLIYIRTLPNISYAEEL